MFIVTKPIIKSLQNAKVTYHMMSFVGSVKNIEMHGDKIHISEQDFKA